MADKSKRRRRLVSRDFTSTPEIPEVVEVPKEVEEVKETKKVSGEKQQYVFSLKDSQVFSVSYKGGDIVTLYIDADGTVYPEKYALALENGILLRKKEV